MSADLTSAARGCALAEVAWRGGRSRWSTAVLVPLVDAHGLVFALPYAERARAAALAAADELVVVCSDQRLALRGFAPVAGRGIPTLEADPTGEVMQEGLLDEELRKHPPSRLLADSLLLQREHWWYLPRLLVRVEVVASWGVGGRSHPRQGVLLSGEGVPVARTVEVVADEGDRLVLADLAGGMVPAAGVATLLRHDASLPDLEQRSNLVQRGHMDGATLVVEEAEGELALPEPARLLARYRRAKAFERACRRALIEHRASSA